MGKICIIDPDNDSRLALNILFKNMGLDDVCAASSPQEGSEGGAVFPRPVRAGVILDWVRVQRAAVRAWPETIRFGGYTLNTINHELACPGGAVLRLTEKEGQLMALLAQAQGAAVSRKEILERIWSYSEGVESHTLETHVHRLRQKIEKDPARPGLILTDDAGYKLRMP